MSNYKVNEKEQRKAESIRRQYVSHEDNKMEQLQKLDHKVKRPGKIVSFIIGTAGVLVMGAGMANIMVWENMNFGLTLGIPGMIVALMAYPIYSVITNNRKKKYANEIIQLSDTVTRM